MRVGATLKYCTFHEDVYLSALNILFTRFFMHKYFIVVYLRALFFELQVGTRKEF